MVRVPGSLGDSWFHRESHEEAYADLRETSVVGEWITNDIAESRSIRGSAELWEELYRRNSGRACHGPRKEASTSPPQVPSGTPADFDSRRDLQDESPPAKAIQALVSKSSTKRTRSKPLRKKIKAPGSDADDQDDLKTIWTDESLEIAYYKKELHTFLIKNPVMQIIKPKIISDLKGP
ncbi:LOW QUALITY PROTEIN: Hypothetical protein PHPALM_11147, partial [Phytophthora palmivora]